MISCLLHLLEQVLIAEVNYETTILLSAFTSMYLTLLEEIAWLAMVHLIWIIMLNNNILDLNTCLINKIHLEITHAADQASRKSGKVWKWNSIINAVWIHNSNFRKRRNDMIKSRMYSHSSHELIYHQWNRSLDTRLHTNFPGLHAGLVWRLWW